MIGRLMAICLAVGILSGCSSIDLIAHGFKAWGSDEDTAKPAPKEEAPPAIPPSKEQAAQRDVIRAEELPPP